MKNGELTTLKELCSTIQNAIAEIQNVDNVSASSLVILEEIVRFIKTIPVEEYVHKFTQFTDALKKSKSETDDEPSAYLSIIENDLSGDTHGSSDGTQGSSEVFVEANETDHNLATNEKTSTLFNGTSMPNHNIIENVVLNPDNEFNLLLVYEAIEDLESDNQHEMNIQEISNEQRSQESVDIQLADSTSVDESQNVNAEIVEIQAEEVITTSETTSTTDCGKSEQNDCGPSEPSVMNENSRPKRKVKTKPEVETFLKRSRRQQSVDVRSTATAKLIDTEEETPATASNLKLEMAMKKRQSAIRKTVSFTPITFKYDDDADCKGSGKSPDAQDIKCENSAEQSAMMIQRKNTHNEMYPTNTLYKTWCLLCDSKKNQFLVAHYLKNHPEHEIPIARPSPDMASRIREEQKLQFTKSKNKITGICVFCETTKNMPKPEWARHLLTHTGEKMFYCVQCDTCLEMKKQHDAGCSGVPVNIFAMNDSNEINYPLTAFMCKDCNYLQVRRCQLVKHLENEHGYKEPHENAHYHKFTLVPNL